MYRVTMFPAADGDCFFLETGPEDRTHRILVDGGRSATAASVLLPFLRALPARDGADIDLVILTHIDADHIEGLLELLCGERPPTVREIWFNGYNQVRVANGKRALPQLHLSRRPSAVDTLGVHQAERLTDMVTRYGLAVNAAFDQGPVVVARDGALPIIDLASRARLTLLGPTPTKLGAMEAVWQRELERLSRREQVEVLEARRRPVLTVENIAEIARRLDEPDTAKPNGSSIIFSLQYGGRSALFLADAHPDDAARALTRLDGFHDRMHFDAVKVAHHGSAANNTSQLIGILSADRWLVSTNGSRHQHPDPEAIARIVLSSGKQKQLLFNYQTDYNKAWAAEDLPVKYNYTARYSPAGEPITIDLEQRRD